MHIFQSLYITVLLVLFKHNKTPKVFCLTFGVHVKKEGTESSFPVKMHLIVQHKAWSSVKSHGFTDEAVKMTVSSVKWQVFTDDLKKLVLIAPFRGANVVQKSKRKIANP